MASYLQRLREKDPRLTPYSDEQLIDSLHRLDPQFSSLSREEAAAKLTSSDGFGAAFKSGVRDLTRNVGLTVDTWQGDTEEALATTQKADLSPTTFAQDAFRKAIASRGPADSFLGGLKNVAGAAIDEPLGFLHDTASQIANMAPQLGGGAIGGALGGTISGPLAPLGAFIGAAAGRYLGGVLTETGAITQEKAADDILTPEELSEASKQGLIKAGVITVTDLIGIRFNKLLLGAPGKAATRAATETLAKNGVDLTSAAAIRTALASERVGGQVVKAAEDAFKANNTFGLALARKATGLGVETATEMAGEFGGSVAAGLDFTFEDVAMEGLLSGPLSLTETALAGRGNTPKQTPEGILARVDAQLLQVAEQARQQGGDELDAAIAAATQSAVLTPQAIQVARGGNKREALTEVRTNLDALQKELADIERKSEGTPDTVIINPLDPKKGSMTIRGEQPQYLTPAETSRRKDLQAQLKELTSQARSLQGISSTGDPFTPSLAPPDSPQTTVDRMPTWDAPAPITTGPGIPGEAVTAPAAPETRIVPPPNQRTAALSTLPAAEGVAAPDSRPPAITWAGRDGLGYPTTEAAARGADLHRKLMPELDWKLQSLPTGRTQVVGYKRTPDMPPNPAKTTLDTPDTEASYALTDAVMQGAQTLARESNPARAMRSAVIDRAMKAIEARQGVATQAEADLLTEYGMGKPYDSVEAAPAANEVPQTIWTGRRGDGYPSPEAAAAGLIQRREKQPEFAWRAEQMPSGRFQLVGYSRDPVAPPAEVPPSVATAPGGVNAVESSVPTAPADVGSAAGVDASGVPIPAATAPGGVNAVETSVPAVPADVGSAAGVDATGVPIPAATAPGGVNAVESSVPTVPADVGSAAGVDAAGVPIPGATAPGGVNAVESSVPTVPATAQPATPAPVKTTIPLSANITTSLKVGDVVTASADIGPVKAGARLTVTAITETGGLKFSNPSTGTFNNLGAAALARAGKAGVTFDVESPAPAAQETPSQSQPRPLSTPSNGAIVDTSAQLVGKIGPAFTVRDGETDHAVRAVNPTKLGAANKLVTNIAKLFGKRVVVFESDTLQADGFVLPNDDKTVYLKADSGVSPLAVFGHELLHQLKRDNPTAYAALEAVVRGNLTAGGAEAFAGDYGAGANLEELTADLVGNRFRDTGFWESVFAEIEAQSPAEAKGLIRRLAEAIIRAVDQFLTNIKGESFNADAFVTDLEAVKSAVTSAVASYLQSQKTVKATTPAAEGPAQLSPSREAPRYGKARDGSISVTGTHYSAAERTTLDGRRYGAGSPGAESTRLANARDKRLKQRVHFYVDTGKGTTPERGVGAVKHDVRLDNLYDPDSKLIPKQRDTNAFESAVINAGFDGYYVKDFGNQGAAVLLGPKHTKVPVRRVPVAEPPKTEKPVKAEPPPPVKETPKAPPAEEVKDKVPAAEPVAKAAPKKEEPKGKPLKDIRLTETLEDPETGQKSFVNMSAQEAVDDIDSRLNAMKKLIACLKK